MKELSFERMEKIEGGMTYCEQLWWWISHDYEGYQGSISYLISTFMTYCSGNY